MSNQFDNNYLMGSQSAVGPIKGRVFTQREGRNGERCRATISDAGLVFSATAGRVGHLPGQGCHAHV